MHVDEEHVERLLHGELLPRVETSVREHLAACAPCRGRVADAGHEETDVQSLLRHLDHPLPTVDAGAIVRRARTRERHWGRWAAGIAAAVGLGGASYAIPGSPIAALVETVAQWAGGRADRSAANPTPAPPPPSTPKPAPEPTVAGIAVVAGNDLVIAFTSPRGAVRVSLTSGTEVVVRAPAGAAIYTSDVDRLVIDNATSETTFDLEIPRAATRVEIRVGKQRIWLKEGPRVVTNQHAPAGGSDLLRLSGSQP